MDDAAGQGLKSRIDEIQIMSFTPPFLGIPLQFLGHGTYRADHVSDNGGGGQAS